MAGVQLASLLLFCTIISTIHCRPNWFYTITNPQVTVIRCSHDFLWKYGAICVKFPLQCNTTNPVPANPVPAPPPQTPVQAPGESPPEESPTASEEPPPSTPSEESTTTPPPVETVNPTATRAGQNRPRRGIHLGPEFSLSLPPLKPPLTLNLPPLGHQTIAQPPTTVVVQMNPTYCCV